MADKSLQGEWIITISKKNCFVCAMPLFNCFDAKGFLCVGAVFF
jgi:hypothetical protein